MAGARELKAESTSILEDVRVSRGEFLALLDLEPAWRVGLPTYRAVVRKGVKDLSGTSLDQDPSVVGNQRKVWSFTIRP